MGKQALLVNSLLPIFIWGCLDETLGLSAIFLAGVDAADKKAVSHFGLFSSTVLSPVDGSFKYSYKQYF